jgi:hypothetical protein
MHTSFLYFSKQSRELTSFSGAELAERNCLPVSWPQLAGLQAPWLGWPGLEGKEKSSYRSLLCEVSNTCFCKEMTSFSPSPQPRSPEQPALCPDHFPLVLGSREPEPTPSLLVCGLSLISAWQTVWRTWVRGVIRMLRRNLIDEQVSAGMKGNLN